MKIYITTKIFSILISPKSWNRNTWSNTGRVVENVKRCINYYIIKFINESRNFTLDFVGFLTDFSFYVFAESQCTPWFTGKNGLILDLKGVWLTKKKN